MSMAGTEPMVNASAKAHIWTSVASTPYFRLMREILNRPKDTDAITNTPKITATSGN